MNLSSIDRTSLVNGSWRFVRADGTKIAENIAFAHDGRLLNHRHENERSWKIESGVLKFRNSHGLTTTSFDEITITQDGKRLLSGPFLLSKNITHILEEKNEPRGRKPKRKFPNMAVFVRSHVIDNKVIDLFNMLKSSMFDTFLLVDVSNRPFPINGPSVVAHSIKMCQDDLRLCPNSPGYNYLWFFGDYPIYCAYELKPGYDFYLQIEYDVHFTRGNALYVEGLAHRLQGDASDQGDLGLAGSHYQKAADTWIWSAAAKRIFPEVYSVFFPFICLSAESIKYLLEMRRSEAKENENKLEYVHCEAFVASALKASGKFSCLDLNDIIANSYDPHTFRAGEPMFLGAGLAAEKPVEMLHPVLDAEGYVRKLCDFSRRTGSTDHLRRAMLDETLPEKLRSILSSTLIALNKSDILISHRTAETPDLSGGAGRLRPVSQHLIAHAQQALDAGNLVVASRLWTKAVLRQPDDPAGHVGLTVALNRAKKYDAADAASSEALARFPENARIVANHAWLAHNRSQWDEAAARWRGYREKFPDHAIGYSAAGVALRHGKRFAEADAILLEGLQRHPDHPELLGNYAWVAHHRPDWPEAVARWRVYRDKFPDHPIGYSAAGVALRHDRRFAEADAILLEGLQRHPDHPELLGNYAWVAHRRGDWPEAAARWRVYREKFPDHAIGYSSLGVALRELARFDEADAVLREGLALHPDNGELIGNYAWVAYNRHDWPEALKRWEAFRDKFPDNPVGHRQVMLVLGELGRFVEAEALARPAALRQTGDSALARLMLEFESLGENCEFGVVQRYFGADPLGLLRFTAIPPALLTTALRERFAGVGLPENTTLSIHKNEYLAGDTRYHMAMHTFIRAGNEDRQKRFANICRRLVFLRDKLIGDLELAEKHFVYGSRLRLSDDDIRSLWQAMRTYGKNRLLFVHPSEAGETPGTTRRLEDDLIVGCIDQLSVEAPSFDLWLQLCRQAHDCWSAAAPG
jgi:Flp pilus assembly protein TadD